MSCTVIQFSSRIIYIVRLLVSVVIMQFENIKDSNCIGLHKYEIAISDILNYGYSLNTAATAYGLDINYLSIFTDAIFTKGRVIKGIDRNISFLDELAFLLYVKICPQDHCVCLKCFKIYLPRLIYKFSKRNKLTYPQYWDKCQKADESTKRKFLKKNKNEISSLFSEDCLRLSPKNQLQKSFHFDIDLYHNH